MRARAEQGCWKGQEIIQGIDFYDARAEAAMEQPIRQLDDWVIEIEEDDIPDDIMSDPVQAPLPTGLNSGVEAPVSSDNTLESAEKEPAASCCPRSTLDELPLP